MNSDFNIPYMDVSPPARVAWIETRKLRCRQSRKMVATREGGVDRNAVVLLIQTGNLGRHPRGWRG